LPWNSWLRASSSCCSLSCVSCKCNGQTQQSCHLLHLQIKPRNSNKRSYGRRFAPIPMRLFLLRTDIPVQETFSWAVTREIYIYKVGFCLG
jgi:hypothetical protein